MKIKSILVPFGGSEDELSALNAAFTLSKDFRSITNCLHITNNKNFKLIDIPSPTNHLITDVNNKNLTKISEEALIAYQFYNVMRQKNNIPEFSENSRNLFSSKFIADQGDLVKLISYQSRINDLVIFSRAFRNFSDSHATAANMSVFNTGKPIIFTPTHIKKLIGYNVVIAWNGSSQSARAVDYALTLLHQAKNIYILTAGIKHRDKPSDKDLQQYLSLHGLDSKCVHIQGGDNTKEKILTKCNELEADLLVMGAFAHNKIRQMLIGGVTKHILANATFSVLMAH